MKFLVTQLLTCSCFVLCRRFKYISNNINILNLGDQAQNLSYRSFGDILLLWWGFVARVSRLRGASSFKVQI